MARPLLPLAVALYVLGALAREVTHRHAGGLASLPVVLAAAGVAWPTWCLVRLVRARLHQAALEGWRQRAGERRGIRRDGPR